MLIVDYSHTLLVYPAPLPVMDVPGVTSEHEQMNQPATKELEEDRNDLLVLSEKRFQHGSRV